MSAEYPVSGIDCPAENFQDVRRLWERFHSETLDPEGLIEPYQTRLVEDWHRCAQLGVDPGLQEATVVSPMELERVSRENNLLLNKARRVMDRMPDALRGIPGALLLTDAKGTILHVSGWPSSQLAHDDTSNFIPGAQFAEALAGTNGIATAIARRDCVRVHGWEHYCEGWHRWSCTVAPIMDPFADELLGVLDFSVLSGYEANMVPLTVTLADKIREDLRLQVGMERIRLLEEYKSFATRYPSDTVVVYDRMGRLLHSTLGVEPPARLNHPPEVAAEDWEIHTVPSPDGEEDIGTVIVVPSPWRTP